MSICTSCKIEKPDTEFPRRRRKPTEEFKLHKQCRACINKMKVKHREKEERQKIYDSPFEPFYE